MNENNIKDVLKHITESKDALDKSLFDSNELLQEDVRNGLMAISNKVIEKTIGHIEGLEISDIYLVGSASNYWYHEESDIDIRIEVINKKCRYIAKDSKHFDIFLSSKMSALKEKGYKFYFHNRLVDIKLAAERVHFISMYSIKNNCWIVYPQKRIFKKINDIEIIGKYHKYKADLERKYYNLKKEYKNEELAKRLNDLYIDTVTPCVTGSPSLMDCILFKLLSHDGSLKKIASESIQIYNKVFSLDI